MRSHHRTSLAVIAPQHVYLTQYISQARVLLSSLSRYFIYDYLFGVLGFTDGARHAVAVIEEKLKVYVIVGYYQLQVISIALLEPVEQTVRMVCMTTVQLVVAVTLGIQVIQANAAWVVVSGFHAVIGRLMGVPFTFTRRHRKRLITSTFYTELI